MIEINKNIIYQELKIKIDKIFSLPETSAVKIKNIVIEKTQDKDYIYKMVKQAVEISYHDVLSDIDMSVMVKLSSKDTITKEQYVKMLDGFWFVQVQALGKLYRNDFLISDHLANININETLVQQMVLRDIKYGTNFHRFGYKEELEYLKADENECPYKRDNKIFNHIANKIYASSITYDKLTLHFYPEYIGRKEALFDIWEYYAQAAK